MDFLRIHFLEQEITQVASVYEHRIVVFIVALVAIILFSNLFLFLNNRVMKNLLLPPSLKDLPTFKEKVVYFFKKYYVLVIAPFVIFPLAALLWSSIYVLFIVRPYVYSSVPSPNSTMENAEPYFVIEFDLPVDKSSMYINMSPEIKGEWIYESVSKNSKLSRKVVFIPEESVNPGQPVVIYVTGLRSWLSDGKLHEYAIEFDSPNIPNVKEVYPADEQENFNPTHDAIVKYDSPIGEFVEYRYSIEPTVEFDIERLDNFTEVLRFKNDLEQDKEYKLTVLREVRVFKLESKVDVTRTETENISEIGFTTSKAPLLSEYSPTGQGADPESVIIAKFDYEMNREDVEKNFSIEPNVEGTIEWGDDSTFMFTPNVPLTKGTTYVVRFSPGIRNEFEGKTEQEITFSFETAGVVSVLGFNPLNYTTGLELTTPVSVTFNQPVVKSSAESKFSIFPLVEGTFSWNENTLSFTPTIGYEYYTNYTITILPGVESLFGDSSQQTYSSVFGTKSDLFTLTLPWYRQEENFTCNCAAARMVLAYYGVYLTEAEIKNGIGISDDPNVGWVPGYGVHVGPVANFVGQYREVEIKTGWTVEELAAEVEQGHPVILWWYNRYSQPAGAFTLPSGATGYTGMHSEIARGFKGPSSAPTAILVHDPWRQYLEYDTDMFVSNWGYLNYTALVVR